MKTPYQRITQDNKLIFYSTRFESFWEYEAATSYKATATIFIPVIGICITLYSCVFNKSDYWQLLLISPFFLIWIFLTIKSAIKKKIIFLN
jgi:hypothetical protein